MTKSRLFPQSPWIFGILSLLLFTFIMLPSGSTFASQNQKPSAYLGLNLNSFLSSDLSDSIEAIAIDDTGAIYVAGKTSAPGFPLVNPYQTFYGGGDSDGFITIFAPDGQSILASTYLGGSGTDSIMDIEIGENGRIFVAGSTDSPDFPTISAHQPASAGLNDGFITAFNSGLMTLSYSSYHGGSQNDFIRNLALAPDESVHVVGYTQSPDFPVALSIQPYQGNEDVFVSGLSPNGQSLVYSTYLGGTEDERAFDIVLDGNGRKYIVGYTESSNYPTINAYQSTFAGGLWDGIISIISNDNQSLEQSTFLGGTLNDSLHTIALDMNGRIHVGGSTDSFDFPVVNPYQPLKSDFKDGTMTIFQPDGQSIIYSTYLGGNSGDTVESIAIDNSNRIYAVGYTFSTNFPLENPYQPANNGLTDVFLAFFEPGGSLLNFSSYLGGEDGEVGAAIEISQNDLVYVTGTTWSRQFPVVNPFQPELTGVQDGFVSIMDSNGQSLNYSTYFGGFYPAPNNVSLTDISQSTAETTTNFPSVLWLFIGLIAFLVFSLILKYFAPNTKGIKNG